MAFDQARGRTVLFTASNRGTWEWDGTDWNLKSPTTSPSVCGFGLAYDASRSRVVLLTGTSMGDAWEWDGSDWTNRTPLNPPPSGSGGVFAYDAARARIVFYAGGFGETWEYAPLHPATHASFGTGCAGSAGVPALAATAGHLPWLGDQFALRVQNLPPGNSGLVWLGTSRTTWGTLALPLDLTPIGMNGCALRVRPALTVPFFNFTGSAVVSLGIPNDTSLLGSSFFSQALVVDRGANVFGATTSNGGEGVFGAR